MQKTFCDGCGAETTNERETGSFTRKHMPKHEDMSSWGLREYALCPTCAIKVEVFVRSLESTAKRDEK